MIPNIPIVAPPKIITATAPADAPDEIPKIYGSAMGFLVIHCINTPEIASPPPVIAESNTLGTLISQIIASIFFFQVGEKISLFKILLLKN